jgi:hypothetical protein
MIEFVHLTAKAPLHDQGWQIRDSSIHETMQDIIQTHRRVEMSSEVDRLPADRIHANDTRFPSGTNVVLFGDPMKRGKMSRKGRSGSL